MSNESTGFVTFRDIRDIRDDISEAYQNQDKNYVSRPMNTPSFRLMNNQIKNVEAYLASGTIKEWYKYLDVALVLAAGMIEIHELDVGIEDEVMINPEGIKSFKRGTKYDNGEPWVYFKNLSKRLRLE